MARLTPFGYRFAETVFHRMDPRFKLGCLAAVTVASLNAGLGPVGLLILLAFWGTVRSGLPAGRAIRELRPFFLLLLFVFAARSLATPGDPVVSGWGVTVTRQGVLDGVLVSGRLLAVALASLLLVATTGPWEIKAAVERLLTPVPLVPARRVATMFALVLRFLPIILRQARETAEAQRARGMERRNPLFRLIRLMVPLLRRILVDADELTTAMTARCYTEDRTGPALSARRSDWAALAVAVGGCAVLIFL